MAKKPVKPPNQVVVPARKEYDPTKTITSECGKYVGSFVLHFKEINTDMIFALAQQGVPKDDIAKICGISIHALNKKYGDIILAGNENTKAKLRNRMISGALEGDTQLLLFLARTWLKMNDKQVIEISNPRDELKEVSSDDLIEIVRNADGPKKES